MSVTESQRRIAQKYGLSGCEFQTSAGEVPCCYWKWAWALNGSKSAANGLSQTRQKTGVSTACVPGSMPEACHEGME